MVTPGNPLKDTRGLAPLAERIAAAQALADHPRIEVTGVEAQMRTRYTYDTVAKLIARCPGVRFVWIMGADNLRSFHRWQKWRAIANLVPIAVVDRVGPSLYATAGTAGQALARFRIPETAATLAAAPAAARLGVPARAEVAAVLHGAAGAAGAHDPRKAGRFSDQGHAPKKCHIKVAQSPESSVAEREAG